MIDMILNMNGALFQLIGGGIIAILLLAYAHTH